MKNLAALTLALVAGVLIGRFSGDESERAWAEDGGPVEAPADLAADLNGDGGTDVSDAVFLLRYLFQGGPEPATREVEPVTTLLVTRHAEKESGEDPGLTPTGQLRAEQFARLVGDDDIDVMITSGFRRTVETLLPLVEAKGLTEGDLVQLNEIEEVVEFVSGVEPGSTVALCHHSFTLHQILDGLCVSGHEDISIGGSNYDNWFVVELQHGAANRLHHFRYAEIPEVEEPEPVE